MKRRMVLLLAAEVHPECVAELLSTEPLHFVAKNYGEAVPLRANSN